MIFKQHNSWKLYGGDFTNGSRTIRLKFHYEI